MQGQSQQQAYDRGITIFSPDGRLYQVEYAREAVKRGSASIGVRTAEGVVLVVDKRSRSPLMEASSVEKLHKADDHIGIASAGHVADARQLIDYARRMAQGNRLRYGESVGVETLTKYVTDHIQENTQRGGTRPYGAALLVGGLENGRPRLFGADPSGTPHEWKATAIGGSRGEIQEVLEEGWTEALSLDGGIDLALRALLTADDELEASDLSVATITEHDGYQSLTVEEMEELLEGIDIPDDGETEDEEE